MPDEFGGVEVEEPKTDDFGGLAVDSFPTKQQPPRTGLERAARDYALGPLARAQQGKPPPAFDQSALGISPEMVPSGANTRAPWLTIPASVAGKTAAGLAGYITSPQGALETALAATPAAPVIFAKWAYDMAKGGYKSVRAMVDELGQMANEGLNKGIIKANQLGPVPEGKTTQEHIQSLAENAANAALMATGALGTGLHAAKLVRGRVGTPPATEPLKIPESPPEIPPTAITEGAPPTAPTTVTGESGGVVAPPTELPKVKGGTPQLVEQSKTVTQPVTQPYTALAEVLHSLPDEIKKDVSIKGIKVVQFPSTLEGSGALYKNGWVLLEEGEPVSKDTILHEVLHNYVLKHPELYDPNQMLGMEKAVDTLHSQLKQPGQGPEMGAAGIKELPPLGAGGEKYGVAERIRAERAQAGQVEPVPPGKGMSTQETIKLGRDIVRRDPQAGPRILEAFENDPKKATSTEGRSVVRAHGEALAAGARTIEENYGTESPEYKAAKNFLDDWDRRSKAMDTEFQKQGMAMQGETDIDTGSFTGLNRAHREATGKDIPKQQKPKANKIAANNKKAQAEVDKASALIKTRIREKSPVDAEKAALDAASNRVRQAAAKLADDENKARSAQAQRDKDAANIQVKASQEALDAAKKREVDARKKFIKESQRRAADPSIAVWEKANEYLDENKGLYSFDDIRNQVATDLKMPVRQVTDIMAQDARTKRLADDIWVKQRNARRLKEQAKIWLRELHTPGYQKALMSIPNTMFSISVGGHGFVALGTHAPIVAFQPRFWNAYVRNFGKMYKMVFSPAYYEQQMQDLVRRPNYEVARRAGLQNDPFKYEEFHTTALRDLVKDWIGEKNMNRVDNLASAGNRGYGVLKLLRQDMFDQRYAKLPKSIRVQEGVLEGVADGVNHATGVTQKQGFKGSNLLFFAPRLEASRVAWLTADPGRAAITMANWKKASAADKQFAIDQVKEKAWVFGTFASLLAMNQGFLSAAGSKQKINGIPEALGGAGIDPLASDFLKFKALGADIAYGGALLTMAKLPARVATAILYEGKGSRYILEDERVDKVIGQYIRSQMSPFAGTVSDLALGRDYEERPLPRKLFGVAEQPGAVPKRLQAQGVDEPYNWPEYTMTKLPIPMAEGIKEGLRASGMAENQINPWLKAFAVGSLMSATGTRITEDTREE